MTVRAKDSQSVSRLVVEVHGLVAREAGGVGGGDIVRSRIQDQHSYLCGAVLAGYFLSHQSPSTSLGWKVVFVILVVLLVVMVQDGGR